MALAAPAQLGIPLPTRRIVLDRPAPSDTSLPAAACCTHGASSPRSSSPTAKSPAPLRSGCATCDSLVLSGPVWPLRAAWRARSDRFRAWSAGWTRHAALLALPSRRWPRSRRLIRPDERAPGLAAHREVVTGEIPYRPVRARSFSQPEEFPVVHISPHYQSNTQDANRTAQCPVVACGSPIRHLARMVGGELQRRSRRRLDAG